MISEAAPVGQGQHRRSRWSNRGFQSCRSLDSDSVQALENLGSAKARKGDFEGAIADYNQAIQLDPKDFGAFEMRALTKQLRGDFEGALGDLVLFDELAPLGESQDYPHLCTWLVRVRRGQSRRTESLLLTSAAGGICQPRIGFQKLDDSFLIRSVNLTFLAVPLRPMWKRIELSIVRHGITQE
jgi:tetratricopeptide (TPR) repeat protein